MSEHHLHDPQERLRHFGGRPSIALANSVLWRRSASPRDLIEGYPDVVEHLELLDGLPASDPDALRALADADPQAAEAAWERTLALRELLFRVLSAVAAGDAPAGGDLEAFNAAAAGALARSRVVPVDGGFRRSWDGTDAPLDEPAWEVLRDAQALLLDPAEVSRLKQCPGPQCGWLFLDESRNRSRRWCDPRLCGNRERVKTHYRRHRARTP